MGDLYFLKKTPNLYFLKKTPKNKNIERDGDFIFLKEMTKLKKNKEASANKWDIKRILKLLLLN